MGRRALVGLLVGAGILLVGLAALLFLEFDSPRLGRWALARASAATGLEVRAEAFRLRPARGLVLEAPSARGRRPDGSRIDASADRLVLEHRLLQLLRGRVAVDSLVLERPRVEIRPATVEPPSRTAGGQGGRAPAEEDAPAAEEAGAEGGLIFDVGEIRLEDAEFREWAAPAADGDGTAPPETATDESGGPETEVVGLDLRLGDLYFDPAADPAARLSGRGPSRGGPAPLGRPRGRGPGGRGPHRAGRLPPARAATRRARGGVRGRSGARRQRRAVHLHPVAAWRSTRRRRALRRCRR